MDIEHNKHLRQGTCTLSGNRQYGPLNQSCKMKCCSFSSYSITAVIILLVVNSSLSGCHGKKLNEVNKQEDVIWMTTTEAHSKMTLNNSNAVINNEATYSNTEEVPPSFDTLRWEVLSDNLHQRFEEDKKLFSLLPISYDLDPIQGANVVKELSIGYDYLNGHQELPSNEINKHQLQEKSFVSSNTLKDIIDKFLYFSRDQLEKIFTDYGEDSLREHVLAEFIRLYKTYQLNTEENEDGKYVNSQFRTNLPTGVKVLHNKQGPSRISDKLNNYVLREYRNSKTKLKDLIELIWFDPKFAENHKWQLPQLSFSDKLGHYEISPGDKDYQTEPILTSKTNQSILQDNDLNYMSSANVPLNALSRPSSSKRATDSEGRRNKQEDTKRYSSNFKVFHSDDISHANQRKHSNVEISSGDVKEKSYANQELLETNRFHKPHSLQNIFKSSQIQDSERIGKQSIANSFTTIVADKPMQSNNEKLQHLNDWVWESDDDLDRNILRFLEQLHHHTFYRNVLKTLQVNKKNMNTDKENLNLPQWNYNGDPYYSGGRHKVLQRDRSTKNRFHNHFLPAFSSQTYHSRTNRIGNSSPMPVKMHFDNKNLHNRSILKSSKKKSLLNSNVPVIAVTVMSLAIALAILGSSTSPLITKAARLFPSLDELGTWAKYFDERINDLIKQGYVDASDYLENSPQLNKTMFLSENNSEEILFDGRNITKHRNYFQIPEAHTRTKYKLPKDKFNALSSSDTNFTKSIQDFIDDGNKFYYENDNEQNITLKILKPRLNSRIMHVVNNKTQNQSNRSKFKNHYDVSSVHLKMPDYTYASTNYTDVILSIMAPWIQKKKSSQRNKQKSPSSFEWEENTPIKATVYNASTIFSRRQKRSGLFSDALLHVAKVILNKEIQRTKQTSFVSEKDTNVQQNKKSTSMNVSNQSQKIITNYINLPEVKTSDAITAGSDRHVNKVLSAEEHKNNLNINPSIWQQLKLQLQTPFSQNDNIPNYTNDKEKKILPTSSPLLLVKSGVRSGGLAAQNYDMVNGGNVGVLHLIPDHEFSYTTDVPVTESPWNNFLYPPDTTNRAMTPPTVFQKRYNNLFRDNMEQSIIDEHRPPSRSSEQFSSSSQKKPENNEQKKKMEHIINKFNLQSLIADLKKSYNFYKNNTRKDEHYYNAATGNVSAREADMKNFLPDIYTFYKSKELAQLIEILHPEESESLPNSSDKNSHDQMYITNRDVVTEEATIIDVQQFYNAHSQIINENIYDHKDLSRESPLTILSQYSTLVTPTINYSTRYSTSVTPTINYATQYLTSIAPTINNVPQNVKEKLRSDSSFPLYKYHIGRNPPEHESQSASGLFHHDPNLSGLIPDPPSVTLDSSLTELLQTLLDKHRQINNREIVQSRHEFSDRSGSLRFSHDPLQRERKQGLDYWKQPQVLRLNEENGFTNAHAIAREKFDNGVQMKSFNIEKHERESPENTTPNTFSRKLVKGSNDHEMFISMYDEFNNKINQNKFNNQINQNKENNEKNKLPNDLIDIQKNNREKNLIKERLVANPLNTIRKNQNPSEHNVDSKQNNENKLLLELLALQQLFKSFQDRQSNELPLSDINSNNAEPVVPAQTSQADSQTDDVTSYSRQQQTADDLTENSTIEFLPYDLHEHSSPLAGDQNFDTFVKNIYESLNKFGDWSVNTNLPIAEVSIPRKNNDSEIITDNDYLTQHAKTDATEEFQNINNKSSNMDEKTSLENTIIGISEDIKHSKLNENSFNKKPTPPTTVETPVIELKYNDSFNWSSTEKQNKTTGIKSILTLLNPNQPEILTNINRVLDWMIGTPESRANTEVVSTATTASFVEKKSVSIKPTSPAPEMRQERDHVTYRNRSLDAKQNFNQPANASLFDIKHLLTIQIKPQNLSSVISSSDVNEELKSSVDVNEELKSSVDQMEINNYQLNQTLCGFKPCNNFKQIHDSHDSGMQRKGMKMTFPANTNRLQDVQSTILTSTQSNLGSTIAHNVRNHTVDKTILNDNRDYSLNPSELITAHRLQTPHMLRKFDYRAHDATGRIFWPDESNRGHKDLINEKKWEIIDQPSLFISSSLDSASQDSTLVEHVIDISSVQQENNLSVKKPKLHPTLHLKENSDEKIYSPSSSSKPTFRLSNHNINFTTNEQENNFINRSEISISDVIINNVSHTNSEPIFEKDLHIEMPQLAGNNSVDSGSGVKTLVTSFSDSDENQTHILVDVAFNYPVFSQLSYEEQLKLNALGISSSNFDATSNSLVSNPGNISMKDNANFSSIELETFSFGYDHKHRFSNDQHITDYNLGFNKTIDYDMYSYITDSLFEPSFSRNNNSNVDRTLKISSMLAEPTAANGQRGVAGDPATLLLLSFVGCIPFNGFWRATHK